MIGIHPSPDQDPSAIAGAIEHLGTGEKLTFERQDESIRLLGSSPDRVSKMQPDGVLGNLRLASVHY